ncbi:MULTISPECIES: hypothetical protein [Cyanophyceae]|uniref:hypothetical protein n=1 Tax=Cyanophyceae TaxID=3028117 RepID=UPI001F54F333|nr:hypothetical protein [Trichocoleus sp. FACHB-40]
MEKICNNAPAPLSPTSNILCLKSTFKINGCDGSQEPCHTPSLVVKDYVTPNNESELDDFVERSRSALKIASDRLQEKYGIPCGLAWRHLQDIEVKFAH